MGERFPNDPNLRPRNIDRKIYKDIADSLLNRDCTPNSYHLKSKGEIQAAAHVRGLSPSDSKKWFEEHDDDLLEDFQKKYVLLEVTYEQGQGILDGGHTDAIWSDEDNVREIRYSYGANGEEPNRNHLQVEWTTGIPDELVAELVGGRNTAMQVQSKTLANHERKFDWIKELLRDQPYADMIAYRENEPRREKPVDVRELLALMAPFNRDIYSLEGEEGKRLPVSAFSQKQAVLETYIDDQDLHRRPGRRHDVLPPPEDLEGHPDPARPHPRRSSRPLQQGEAEQGALREGWAVHFRRLPRPEQEGQERKAEAREASQPAVHLEERSAEDKHLPSG